MKNLEKLEEEMGHKYSSNYFEIWVKWCRYTLDIQNFYQALVQYLFWRHFVLQDTQERLNNRFY